MLPTFYVHAKGCAKTMDRFSGGEDATPPKYFAPPSQKIKCSF
jgi:hypothetical protein